MWSDPNNLQADIRLAGEPSVSANQIKTGLMTQRGEGQPDLWPLTSFCAVGDPSQWARDREKKSPSPFYIVIIFFSASIPQCCQQSERETALKFTHNIAVYLLYYL